jgi:transglutaminase-like putative cysteine protease
VQFQISYVTDSLAIKRGKIWEINIPQIVTSENVSSYKLAVSTPLSYGKLGKISPTPDTVEEANSRTNFVFTKNSIGTSGIGASFGDYQVFKFKLIYRYKNNNLYTAKATIALPPDTEYQSLYYENIDPRPKSMEYDESGNYLATYNIKSGQTLEVIASGFVQIFNSDANLQKPHSWSKEELKKFTKEDKYIDSGNQLIQKKAKELKDIKEIYNFVTTSLKYDYTRLESDSLGRRGSLAALSKPEQSICTDFSDLFVALARAKGIPARGLVGFAYTDNANLRPTKVEGLIDTTVLHAWPEYYDDTKGRWIQVDPTWGSTTGGIDYFNKLDTNHFVFAINGTKSTSPIPAGGYKTSENQTDDVKVEFSEVLPDINSSFNVLLNRKVVVAGFPGRGAITIENKTGRALFMGNLEVKSDGVFGLISPNKINADLVMPFEKREFSVQLRSNSLIDLVEENLKFELTGKVGTSDYSTEKEISVSVRPFFSVNLEQVILTIMLLIVLVSYLVPRFYTPKPRLK